MNLELCDHVNNEGGDIHCTYNNRHLVMNKYQYNMSQSAVRNNENKSNLPTRAYHRGHRGHIVHQRRHL